jgi:hypothetical protein
MRLYRVVLLTEEKCKDLTLLEDLDKDIASEYYAYDKREKFFKSKAGKQLLFSDIESATVISFTILHFLKCYDLLMKYKILFSYRIYIVHPFSVYLFSPKIKFLNRLLKPFVYLLIRQKIIVFMDEETREFCYDHYNLSTTDNKEKEDIIRLPIEIAKKVVYKAKNPELNILTISRFEFPFKAYVLGLIDTFSRIVQEGGNIRLTIIGYGDGEIFVKEKIGILTGNLRKRIRLLNQIPYSRIDDYIDQCDLYVGMGTTVLDAANRNKICISAVAYQENDLSIGFFHSDESNIGIMYKNDRTYCHFYDLIRMVMDLDDENFLEKERRSKLLLSTHYNIDTNAFKLVMNCHCFSRLEKILVLIYKYIISAYKYFAFVLKRSVLN